LMVVMMCSYQTIYFQFYFALTLTSILGPIASLVVSKNIIDFLKLLQKYEKLLAMVKNILQVFPEGVIIRSKTDQNNHETIRFINNTAKSDFGEYTDLDDSENSKYSTPAARPFEEHEFTLITDKNSQDSPPDDPSDTLNLKQVMEACEYKLVEQRSNGVECQLRMLHQNDDETSALDSHYFTMKTIKVTWEDQENAFMHVFVSTTDIKKLEKEKATNKCLHIMFSSVSHEFRTPLNSFENALALLETNCVKFQKLFPENKAVDNLIQSSQKYIKIGQVSSKLLLNLTEDILDLAKMQAGIFKLSEKTFSISNLLRDIEFIFELQCQRKGIKLVFNCSDYLLHKKVISDSNRIKQILLNLISNSFKFTNQGSVTVGVTQTAHDTLEFEVTDTGIGISESDSTGLFQMFGMVHKNRDEFNMKGTGLGLTISQKLVQRMGGRIKLKSEKNKGTTVTFSIQECFQNSKCGLFSYQE